MTKYLVVAHETASSPFLLEELRHIQAEDETAEFTLLVPATPVRHLLLWRGSSEEATAVATELAARTLKTFQEGQVNLVAARVGAGIPLEAIGDEVTANPGYGGFVISTLPQEHSRWLLMDLPSKVEAKYGLPTHHVTMPPEVFLELS
jgi:hypothetical protein